MYVLVVKQYEPELHPKLNKTYFCNIVLKCNWKKLNEEFWQKAFIFYCYKNVKSLKQKGKLIKKQHTTPLKNVRCSSYDLKLNGPELMPAPCPIMVTISKSRDTVEYNNRVVTTSKFKFKIG